MQTMSERKPKFLIIGAQRSASTLLNTCMQAHPAVFSPNGEIEYFEDPHYNSAPPGYLGRLFEKAPPAEAYGFKRPELLARPECPPRIANELPEVRLIAVLREPIARTVSAYYHYASLRAIPLLPLNDGLKQILDGRLDRQYPMARQIVDYSLYGAQLRRYRDFFDASSILVLYDHQVASDTSTTMARVFEFVGVEAEHASEPVRRAVNAGVFARPRLHFHRMVSPLAYGRTPQYSGVSGNRLSVAAFKALVRFDRSVLARIFGNEKSSLEPAVRARLVQLFRPDAHLLQSMCGDLPPNWSATSDASAQRENPASPST